MRLLRNSVVVKRQVELLLEHDLRLLRRAILELVHQDFEHRAVELFSLRHGHPVHLEGDDIQAGAGEEVDHAAGTRVRKAEVVGLDEDE